MHAFFFFFVLLRPWKRSLPFKICFLAKWHSLPSGGGRPCCFCLNFCCCLARRRSQRRRRPVSGALKVGNLGMNLKNPTLDTGCCCCARACCSCCLELMLPEISLRAFFDSLATEYRRRRSKAPVQVYPCLAGRPPVLAGRPLLEMEKRLPRPSCPRAVYSSSFSCPQSGGTRILNLPPSAEGEQSSPTQIFAPRSAGRPNLFILRPRPPRSDSPVAAARAAGVTDVAASISTLLVLVEVAGFGCSLLRRRRRRPTIGGAGRATRTQLGCFRTEEVLLVTAFQLQLGPRRPLLAFPQTFV